MLFYDWIGIAFSAVLLVLAIISSCLAGSMRANTNDIIIDYYIRINRKYIRSSIWFLAAFYWLTLCSIFSTIVVIYLCAYPTAGQDTKRVFLYSVISLFCTIVNFVTNPRDISTTYRKCYSNLNHTSAAHTTPPVTGVLPLCTRLRRVRRNNPPWRSL